MLLQVATLAGNEHVSWERFETIVASLQREPSRWKLTLRFENEGGVLERALDASSCAELASAAAVSIALALRADRDTSGGWNDDLLASERESGAAPAAVSEPAVTPPSAAADRAVENTRAVAPGAADANAPALSLAAGADALLDPMTFGAAALGASLALELRNDTLAAALYGVGFPSVTTRLGLREAIALGLWAGGARGCLRWDRGLDSCALMEIGQLRAEGVGLLGARTARDVWAAPGLSVGLSSTPFDAFAITLRLWAFHPLIRGRFRVDESDIVHRVPRFSFRAALGIDVPLL